MAAMTMKSGVKWLAVALVGSGLLPAAQAQFYKISTKGVL
jgi:hypothetical protein